MFIQQDLEQTRQEGRTAEAVLIEHENLKAELAARARERESLFIEFEELKSQFTQTKQQIATIQGQAEEEKKQFIEQMTKERARQESIVCKKMDSILAAKQEADRKFEVQQKELQQLRSQMS